MRVGFHDPPRMRVGFHDPPRMRVGPRADPRADPFFLFFWNVGGVEAVAMCSSSVRHLQAKPRGVSSGESDATNESASFVVCVLWNNVTALCFE